MQQTCHSWTHVCTMCTLALRSCRQRPSGPALRAAWLIPLGCWALRLQAESRAQDIMVEGPVFVRGWCQTQRENSGPRLWPVLARVIFADPSLPLRRGSAMTKWSCLEERDCPLVAMSDISSTSSTPSTQCLGPSIHQPWIEVPCCVPGRWGAEIPSC